MAQNDTPLTVVGNATSVELRFTPAGRAACSFRLASTPRRFDKNSNQWVDGETLWLNCTVWGEQGENLAETFGDAKSLRVVVTGRLKQRSYQTKEGENRVSYEVEADEVAPSLKFASAVVNRNPREGGNTPYQGNKGGFQGGGQAPDPWAAGGPQGGPVSDSAPF